MKLNKRRRIECKTNYRKRIVLLKGNSPRLVIRKTNKYIILQIIKSERAQDSVIFSATTKELLEHGWPEAKQGSLKSLSAAYLGGLLLGKKAKSLKERVVVDTGLMPNTKGSRIYAAVKGAIDSGLKINCDEKVMPSKEMLEGKKNDLSEIFTKVKGGLVK
jgi:large subunit ribosomal protein L18